MKRQKAYVPISLEHSEHPLSQEVDLMTQSEHQKQKKIPSSFNLKSSWGRVEITVGLLEQLAEWGCSQVNSQHIVGLKGR